MSDLLHKGFTPRNPRTPRTPEEREQAWRKPMVLNDAMRNVVVRCAEHWGDEMLRTIIQRREDGFLSEEREASMLDEVDAYFELADSLRTKRGIK